MKVSFAGLLTALLCVIAPGISTRGAPSGPASGEWAFQPLRWYPVASAGVSPVRNPVDDFILQKLKEKGLAPAPPADRATLIRRATFDLTGLPPTPEEVDAFVKDRAPDAFPKLIERLLASPRYGERWGRHWLDVVRYADSDGYSNDYERPNAWRYRDYVIRSFNEDKSYDRFIIEQVAGDELDPENPENLIATGFLRMGPWEQTAMSVAAVTRQIFLDDVTHSVGTVFLGLTLGCARCHDHKFDPIPTRDYYRVQAIFAPAQFEKRPARFLPVENQSGFELETARIQDMLRRTEARLAELRDKVLQGLVKKHGVKSADELPRDVVQQATRRMEDLTAADLERERSYRKRAELLLQALDRYRPFAYSVSTDDKKASPESFILLGGALNSPGQRVGPGILSAIRDDSLRADVPETSRGRRLALARWIAHSSNPLTARVMVNRIWQYHFGTGIVATSNNFGLMGERPTHPELLDWLANYFIEKRWSIKEMHRLIMLSATYQRSSEHTGFEKVAKTDPRNRLLSYFSPRRMEAEVLRDSILAVSGELSPDSGGPGTFPEINQDLAAQPRLIMGTLAPAYQPSPARRQRNRRTIYTFQKRSLIDPMIEVFNGPNSNDSCERRDTTTVPSQVFALFNSKFAQDMALALAMRLEKLSSDRHVQIDHAFRLAFSRPPGEEEKKKALEHLKAVESYQQKISLRVSPRKPIQRSLIGELTGAQFELEEEPYPAEYEENIQPHQVSPPTRALADLALGLFNSNEFVYVY